MNNFLKGKIEKMPKLWLWAIALLGTLSAGLVLVYYWRVFYYLDARAFPVRTLTAGVLGICALAVFIAFCIKRVRCFSAKTAIALLFCGLAFVFANPPMQAPDEELHFLRSYALSLGRFDFDYERTYSEDVAKLMAAFPGAWVNAHTSQGVTEDENGNITTYNSAGYALKQQGEQGEVFGVWQGFANYFDTNFEGEQVNEPLSFAFLPYLPSALGMALSRLFGFSALGCFYAGRIANLLCYIALSVLALKNCKRYKAIFLAIIFMPMSLYMAASLNYDALLLGCYWYLASFYCMDKIDKKALISFLAVFVFVNAVKPWISLLFIAIPLFLPASVWCVQKIKKWQFAVIFALSGVAITAFVEWYGTVFRKNYPVVERMLGDTVNGGEQLVFLLSNPLRTIAIFIGTLYENTLFIGDLGVFGYLDLPITAINIFSPLVLMLGVMLSVNKKSTLPVLPCVGLGTLGICYVGALLAALYLTYTPVGMVRVIGLQARYFLPAYLLFAILLCAVLSKFFTLRTAEVDTVKFALPVMASFGFLGAVLLYQHYFIGPVYLY